MRRAVAEAVVYRKESLWSMASPTRRLPRGMVTDPPYGVEYESSSRQADALFAWVNALCMRSASPITALSMCRSFPATEVS
jgi:hypothetical protein